VKPVIFHPDATAELRAAVAYYERQRPGLGIDLQREVERAVNRIQQHPQSFPQHNEADLRKCFVRRFTPSSTWNSQTRFGLPPWLIRGAGQGIGGIVLRSEVGAARLTKACS
jgi:hypothetical protein